MRLRPGGPGSVRVLCCRHAQGDGPSCGCGRPGIAAEASAICAHVMRRGRVVRRRSASLFHTRAGAGCLLLGGENTMPRHRHEAGDRLALAGDHVLFAGLALADATGKRLVGLTQTYRLAHRTPVERVVGALCRAMACYRQGAYPISRGSPLGAPPEWPAFCTVSGRRDRIRSWLEQMVEQDER
jgi:hypothetical protein